VCREAKAAQAGLIAQLEEWRSTASPRLRRASSAPSARCSFPIGEAGAADGSSSIQEGRVVAPSTTMSASTVLSGTIEGAAVAWVVVC
jgi:hypothetical protein